MTPEQKLAAIQHALNEHSIEIKGGLLIEPIVSTRLIQSILDQPTAQPQPTRVRTRSLSFGFH